MPSKQINLQPNRRKNITGVKFNMLTCIGYSHNVGKRTMYKFLCDCGVETIKERANVVSGHTKSCGHIWKEKILKSITTRKNASSRPLWATYKSMIDRCHNPKNKMYSYYGGRGIRVCDEWLKDFYKFEQCVGKRPEGKTLDRVDNNKGYEPGNVRWATRKEQANNTRNNIKFDVDGVLYTTPQLAEHLGLSLSGLSWRLRHWGTYEKS